MKQRLGRYAAERKRDCNICVEDIEDRRRGKHGGINWGMKHRNLNAKDIIRRQKEISVKLGRLKLQVLSANVY